jgi:hypothetical protein
MTTINKNRIELEEQASAPSTPASGKIRFYAKTDGKLYYKDDTGTEYAVDDPSNVAQAVFNEGSAPSTPASGKVSLYAKTDGLLYSKDDAGVEGVVTGVEQIIASGTFGAVTSITISGIPSTYNHLRLYVMARTSSVTADNMVLRVGNGSVDSGLNYQRTRFNIDNTTIAAFSETSGSSMSIVLLGTSGGGNLYSTTIIDLPFYTSSFFKNAHITHKSAASTAIGDQSLFYGGGTWRNTAVITHIGLVTLTSNFASDCQYILYGIR